MPCSTGTGSRACGDRPAGPRPRGASSAAASWAARRLSSGRLGWRDVVLLERAAADLRLDLARRGPGRPAAHQCQHHPAARRTRSSSTSRLEAETGQASGWKMNGGLRLACTAERMTELRRQATTARSFGLEMQLLSPAEAQDLWPLMAASRSGRRRLPADRRPGQSRPTSPRRSPRVPARRGVRIVEDCAVTGFRIARRPGRGRASPTRARSRCEVVALCAGQWSRALGRLAGVARAAVLGPAPVHDHRARSRA